MSLKPIGEPDNILIRLADDVLPEPDAIMITGITPQATKADGITEAEFLKYFNDQICQPDTIFVGFNNIRFDDEFLRFTHYRNFYDAYEWCWQKNRSRWDMLDVIRMTRALRPEGIEWPFDSSGKPSNRLELMTSVNKLDHQNAHDALSDVNATIAVARLIRNKNQKLFDYLLEMRDKNKVKKLAEGSDAFVYTSGRYPSVYHKTTVVTALGEHPGKQGVLVYDLRRNPEEIAHMTAGELAAAWRERVEDETKRFPVKTLQLNRCPAVAPLGVIAEKQVQERIQIDLEQVEKNRKALKKFPHLYANLVDALKILDTQQQASFISDSREVDGQLYDGFFSDRDRTAMSVVRAADEDEIRTIDLEFDDARLTALLPLYKARNFPASLSSEEREEWEKYRYHKLMDGGEGGRASRFFRRLNELAAQTHLTSDQQYLLQELQLYGESILPSPDV